MNTVQSNTRGCRKSSERLAHHNVFANYPAKFCSPNQHDSLKLTLIVTYYQTSRHSFLKIKFQVFDNNYTTFIRTF